MLPITLRITVWYSGLLAGALLLFSLTVYLLMADTLVGNLDTSLQERVSQVATTVDVRGGQIALPVRGDGTDSPAIPAAIRAPSGRAVGYPVPGVIRAWLGAHPGAFGDRFQAWSVDHLRVATGPLGTRGHIIGHVLVWHSLRSVEEARHSLFLVLAGAVPALLVIAGLGGFALARRALVPVATLTATASRISATDLRQRVPVGLVHDELSELAATFNAMIDRLEAAVERERRFTADSSHELRAPLAVVRAEASLALERVRSPAEYRRALQVIDEQAGAMEELVSALLLLTRVESLRTPVTEVVAVERLVVTAIGQCDPCGGHPNVTIRHEVASDLMVRGAAALLTRALRNVIDNAIKLSPPGGQIHIDGCREGGNAVVRIRDQGPGLTVEDQRHVFEAFFQVCSARTPGESHGLGLAICHRIVQAHGGQVTVSSNLGEGTTFVMTLPVADGSGEA